MKHNYNFVFYHGIKYGSVRPFHSPTYITMHKVWGTIDILFLFSERKKREGEKKKERERERRERVCVWGRACERARASEDLTEDDKMS